MHGPTGLTDDCKFALLGLKNVRADIPEHGIVLADGTEVRTRFPIDLDPQWQSWLGIEASEVSSANVVIVRTAATGFSPESIPISDQNSWELAKQAENLFTMLRVLGTLEYDSAFLVMGYVQKAQAVCQHFSKFGRYETTRGCLPWVVREEDLAAATELARGKSSLLASFPDVRKARIFRGWWALTTALQQYYSSDRVHGFVRALEALIYPEISKTEKQFVHRCSMFAAPTSGKDAARQALQDAYKMRCDVEHVHEWDRSLTKYPVADREDIAYWRTRQMESLVCRAYARIFTDNPLQQHFRTDAAIVQFWRRPEHEIRTMFGRVIDITELKVVRNYDGCGRAEFSEWPKGWSEFLKAKHGKRANNTLSAVEF